MLDKRCLYAIADRIMDQISIAGMDQFCQETGIDKCDFIQAEPRPFEGEVYAVDGSNVVICDWSVANLNRIRAGYAVYRGDEWQRTVVTYDATFLADVKRYADQFDQYLEGIFGLGGFKLEEEEELERLSSYFRELQEYIALDEAINEALPGDIILYDGGFTWKEKPMGSVLKKVFSRAEKKEVSLLGVSKSCSISWDEEISRPLIPHTSYLGSTLLPGTPWHLCLSGKTVSPEPDRWKGGIYVVRFDGRSDHAFRVDAPPYMIDMIGETLGCLVGHSSSAECLGYPHSLFRAHRDLRITREEGEFTRLALIDILSDRGMRESEVRAALLDYHDVIEMRTGRLG
jgi:hypothetical protein